MKTLQEFSQWLRGFEQGWSEPTPNDAQWILIREELDRVADRRTDVLKGWLWTRSGADYGLFKLELAQIAYPPPGVLLNA